MINGKVHNFHAGGLYNGLILLRDKETGSYWDHITGEAVHGPLKGTQLDIWGVQMTDRETAINEHGEIPFMTARPKWYQVGPLIFYYVFQFMYKGSVLNWTGFYPPGFTGTMSEVDDRLPEMMTGLGLFENGSARFYPYSKLGTSPIVDTFNGRQVEVRISEEDRIPLALYTDDGSRPMQLFSRWYGFSLTFPHTEIFE
ncbi:MAG: DUF3179 domain-containing (seleno)protein, partial [Chloroflexota bacterium]